MEDKYTPMEAAEVLEVPQKEKAKPVKQPVGYYGTAAPEVKKKNYTGLWILLCLVIVLVGSTMVLRNFLQIRIETIDGRLALTVGEKDTERDPTPSAAEPVNLTPDASPAEPGVKPADNPDFSIAIRKPDGNTESYSVGELYAKANPSIVCVLAESFSANTTGTGVIMTEDGYIVTAGELLEDAVSVTVIFSDSSSVSASVIGTDSSTGVAVIKTDTEAALTPAEFASPDELLIGDPVISIANPYGSQIRNVLSQGIVSAISTEATVNNVLMTLLKTTAELDSRGCPIINSNGQVVAITTDVGTALTDDGSDPQLAISIDSVKTIMENLVRNGYMSANSWLGFDVEDIPDPYQDYYSYPGSLWIASLGSDTAASEMLRLWDVVIAVDGNKVTTIDQYNTALSAHSTGDFVQLTIYRAGRFYLATLPLTSR